MHYFTFPFLFMLLLGFSCKGDAKREIKTEPITFTQEGELTITKSKTDSIVAQFAIEIAASEYETQTGLMYRDALAENQAMLFIFPNMALRSFYMKNTQIPLDIIYIDENLTLVSFQKNARPFDETSLPSRVPAQYVLEINAGLSDELGLEVGDRMTFTKNQ